MTMPLRPERGGFLRPFGCGMFIRDFLLGQASKYWEEIPDIDPDVGAPQRDIHYWYKRALLRAFAEDTVAREEEQRMNKGLPPMTIEQAEERTRLHLERIPYKLTRCRFHSFVVYFSNLQRLGWVEPTGKEEPSEFQDHYSSGPPRRYFRLTGAGMQAADAAWSNPLFALYGERWDREHLRQLRKKHKYTTGGKRGRPVKAKRS